MPGFHIGYPAKFLGSETRCTKYGVEGQEIFQDALIKKMISRAVHEQAAEITGDRYEQGAEKRSGKKDFFIGTSI